MPVPCANKCNLKSVHGRCIYEWSESTHRHGVPTDEQRKSSCPLCRGPLQPISYVPRDKIGSHRFAAHMQARRAFVTRPVPLSAGPVRCYVRAVQTGFLETSMRFELYLQAPTTLRYPLGPLPCAAGPKPGDTLLAVAHKQLNRFGCTQLNMAMDATTAASADAASPAYLGCVLSSFTGLEHTIVGRAESHETDVKSATSATSAKSAKRADDEDEDGDEEEADDSAEDSAEDCAKEPTDDHPLRVELGAVRYTQNRIGNTVGPRRIHVSFPRVAQTVQHAAVAPFPVPVPRAGAPLTGVKRPRQEAAEVDADADNDEEDAPAEQWMTVPHIPALAKRSLTSILRDAVLRAPGPGSGLGRCRHRRRRRRDQELDADMESLASIMTSDDVSDDASDAYGDVHVDSDAVPESDSDSDGDGDSDSDARASDDEPGAEAEAEGHLLFGTNKTPCWLPAINAFSLDFGGRVTLPSNKNFQLIMDTPPQHQQGSQAQHVSLLFGKVVEQPDVEVFSLDVCWPMSPLQAFGVALSACDRKLLCC